MAGSVAASNVQGENHHEEDGQHDEDEHHDEDGHYVEDGHHVEDRIIALPWPYSASLNASEEEHDCPSQQILGSDIDDTDSI